MGNKKHKNRQKHSLKQKTLHLHYNAQRTELSLATIELLKGKKIRES